MCDIKRDEIEQSIVDEIVDMLNSCNIKNEDDYTDELFTSIDDWIVYSSIDEIRPIVEKYGVLKAIRLYKSIYGDIDLDESDNKVYMILCYCILKEWFDYHYSFEELQKSIEE